MFYNSESHLGMDKIERIMVSTCPLEINARITNHCRHSIDNTSTPTHTGTRVPAGTRTRILEQVRVPCTPYRYRYREQPISPSQAIQ